MVPLRKTRGNGIIQRMHRLIVNAKELEYDSPALSSAAANHMKVLRIREGESIEIFDGMGHSRVCIFENGMLRPVSSVTFSPKPASLTLLACITKGSRWDWTIEKATELGATRIVPVISERTIVRIPNDERESKRARWMRVVEDAARQSDAKWIPEILAPVDFAESLSIVRETTCFVGALITPPPQSLLSVLLGQSGSQSNPSLFVGPEGDFTPSELSSLCKIATPVTFGAAVLRAETAAIYGLSVLKSFLDISR